MKKRLGIYAITMVIAGLLITSVASIPASSENEKQITSTKLDLDVGFAAQEAITVTAQKNSDMGMTRDSSIIYDTEYDDYHPTVAGDANDVFFSGFELTIEGDDYYPDFWYSLDGGAY